MPDDKYRAWKNLLGEERDGVIDQVADLLENPAWTVVKGRWVTIDPGDFAGLAEVLEQMQGELKVCLFARPVDFAEAVVNLSEAPLVDFVAEHVPIPGIDKSFSEIRQYLEIAGIVLVALSGGHIFACASFKLLVHDQIGKLLSKMVSRLLKLLLSDGRGERRTEYLADDDWSTRPGPADRDGPEAGSGRRRPPYRPGGSRDPGGPRGPDGPDLPPSGGFAAPRWPAGGPDPTKPQPTRKIVRLSGRARVSPAAGSGDGGRRLEPPPDGRSVRFSRRAPVSERDRGAGAAAMEPRRNGAPVGPVKGASDAGGGEPQRDGQRVPFSRRAPVEPPDRSGIGGQRTLPQQGKLARRSRTYTDQTVAQYSDEERKRTEQSPQGQAYRALGNKVVVRPQPALPEAGVEQTRQSGPPPPVSPAPGAPQAPIGQSTRARRRSRQSESSSAPKEPSAPSRGIQPGLQASELSAPGRASASDPPAPGRPQAHAPRQQIPERPVLPTRDIGGRGR
jgi:hypothetical protein